MILGYKWEKLREKWETVEDESKKFNPPNLENIMDNAKRIVIDYYESLINKKVKREYVGRRVVDDLEGDDWNYKKSLSYVMKMKNDS